MLEECAGDDFVPGDGKFIKWNSNGDYVDEHEDGYPGGIDPIPQARAPPPPFPTDTHNP